MAKIFNIPFATTGDREPIPQESQEDNHVSYTEGYTEEYGFDPATSADALDIERTKFNGLIHDITEAIFELQRHGVALWSADAAPYPAKARVYYNGAVWSSPSGNNNQVPGEGSGWVLNEVIFSTEAQALLGEDGGTAMSPLRTHQAFNQYGLGVKQKNVFTGDVRTLDAEGSYRVGPTATRTPGEVPGTLVVRVLDPDNRTLIFVGQGTSPTIYYTQLRGGVWDEEWYTVWSSQNQLALGKTAEDGRAALGLGSASVADIGSEASDIPTNEVLNYPARTVSGLAELRSLEQTDRPVITQGWANIGDGGTGFFSWNPTLTTADNNGTVIKPASVASGDPGRWVRWVPGNKLTSAAFGIFPDGSDVRGKVLAALSWLNSVGGGELQFGAGKYSVTSGNIEVPAGYLPVTISGTGRVTTTLDFSQAPENTGGGISAAFLEIACALGELRDLTVDGGREPDDGDGGSLVRFSVGQKQRAVRVHVMNGWGAGVVAGGGFDDFYGEDISVENTRWGILIGSGSFNLSRPLVQNTRLDGVTMRFGAGPGTVIAGRTRNTGHSGFSVTNGEDISIIGCKAWDVPENQEGPDPHEAGFEIESREATSRRVRLVDCEAINCNTGFILRERDGNSGVKGFENIDLMGITATDCGSGIVFKDSGSDVSVTNAIFTGSVQGDIFWDKTKVFDVTWSSVQGDVNHFSNENTVLFPDGTMHAFRTVSLNLSVNGWTEFQWHSSVPFYDPENVSMSWNLVGTSHTQQNVNALKNLILGTNPPTGWRVNSDGSGSGGTVKVRVSMFGRWKA